VTSPDPWWRDAVVYEVYARSWADSDGDGVGDLPGITARLPYLADLGVDALWITPFYRSPMADHGYDVADQCDVDPLFGTLTDADRLVERAHELGLRVVVDLVPNHTSSAHPWFQQALRDPAARGRYLFRDGRDGGPPNDWQSVFGGSAWTQVDDGQWYLHLFDSAQPDVDWRHPDVPAEWQRILRFWLDRGVDGFRIDVAHGLLKHPDLPDNPPDPPDDGVLFHASAMPYAWDQPETVEVYRRWRETTDSYDAPGRERVMVGEVFLASVDRVARYVGRDRLHQSFNFPLLAAPLDAARWRALVEQSLRAFEVDGSSPTWVLSNHDVVRHATRYGGGEEGRARALAATLALLALPGSPYLYQGEELGLEQDDVPSEEREDPIWVRSGGTVEGRDGCRTPMPWEAEPPGHGFTTGRPWLPIGEQARTRAVSVQEGVEGSVLETYRSALALRRSLLPGLSREVRFHDHGPDVLAFSRALAGGGALLCVLATGDAVVPVEGELLLASRPGVAVADGAVTLPEGTTAWLRLP
jgi:alpha-glucosidase